MDDEIRLLHRYVPMQAELPIPSEYASVMHARVAEALDDFQRDLAQDEEVGAMVAHFGMSFTIRVTGVGYRNPYLIVFHGETPDGERCELVQHVSQVSFLLVAVKVTSEPARRIGFKTGGDEE